MDAIRASVGKGGINTQHDVIAIQRLLNAQLKEPDKLKVNGVAGPRTVAAIEAFQRHEMRLAQPDGLVEPGRPTFTDLPQSLRRSSIGNGVSGNRLSGAAWRYANQARYPNSSSLDDLALSFRGNARRFITALRQCGASVHVAQSDQGIPDALFLARFTRADRPGCGTRHRGMRAPIGGGRGGTQGG